MKKKIAILVVISALILLLASTTWGSYAQPGSAGDPVVTRSYVDYQINQLRELIMGTNGGTISSDNVSQDVRYIPVQAFDGDVIVGHEGTEIILRSGTASVVVPGENGITNATTGRELLNDAVIERDNLIIIPRQDGRGVRITSEEAWFLIRGGHDIN